MSDIVTKRSTALDRLLQEFDRPPPVPPKDDRRRPDLAKAEISETLPTFGHQNNSQSCVAKQIPTEHVIAPATSTAPKATCTQATHATADNTDNMNLRDGRELVLGTRAAKEDASIVSQVVKARRKRVAFAANDDMLSPPPISLQKESFEDEMSSFELGTSTSVFDPPPAPRFSRFPDQLPNVPKRKPAPLNLNRPTSQTGKWKVRVESEVWTPIDDEPDTASIISMEVRNAPRICPLPYKPIKSVPLRTRGSLRPAPLRVRKGVRFDSVKSPAHLPLKSPAPFGKKVRFDNIKSPAASRFRTPPTPFSSTHFTVLTPGRKQGVRFAAMKSPAVSRFKTPPTPYYSQSSFRMPTSISAKRNVRFDSVKSPARSKFKTPPTPYYDDSFDFLVSEKAVRFANPKSPASSNFRSPPTPYNKAEFRESMSPPDHSPVTPRAMQTTFPAIAPSSPTRSPQMSRHEAAHLHDPELSKDSMVTTRTNNSEAQFPPRTTSLQHRRNVSLPKDLRNEDTAAIATLPATTFDETAVGESTLRWLGMLPKASYRVGSQSRPSDRNQILGSYFHRSTPSF